MVNGRVFVQINFRLFVIIWLEYNAIKILIPHVECVLRRKVRKYKLQITMVILVSLWDELNVKSFGRWDMFLTSVEVLIKGEVALSIKLSENDIIF